MNRENLKGGHTHNHVYNVYFRITYKGNNRRRREMKNGNIIGRKKFAYEVKMKRIILGYFLKNCFKR